MATTIEQLEAMRHLAEGWDGYGTARPKPDLIDLAHEFVSLLQTFRGNGDQGIAIHVSPTRVGGVLLE